MSACKNLADQRRELSLNLKEMISRLECLDITSLIDNKIKEKLEYLEEKIHILNRDIDGINDNLDRNNADRASVEMIDINNDDDVNIHSSPRILVRKNIHDKRANSNRYA